MCYVCVALGSALGPFHCWLGPSFYEYLIYSIYLNIVKSKNRIHLISSSSGSGSGSGSSSCNALSAFKKIILYYGNNWLLCK